MLDPLLKLEEWGNPVSTKIKDGSACPTSYICRERGFSKPRFPFSPGPPTPGTPPALPCSVPGGGCRNLGHSQHSGAGSAEGLGQDWLWPCPLYPVPCPLSLLGEGQAATAALSLPRAVNQQCHLGNKAVISGDTGLGWHLQPGKAAQGSPALLCHPLGHMAMHTEEGHPSLGCSPQG